MFIYPIETLCLQRALQNLEVLLSFVSMAQAGSRISMDSQTLTSGAYVRCLDDSHPSYVLGVLAAVLVHNRTAQNYAYNRDTALQIALFD